MRNAKRISNRYTITAVFCALFATGLQQTRAEEPTVEEIVNRSNRIAYYQAKDGRARVKMTITDSQGRQRRRELVILRRDERPDDEEKVEAFEEDEYTGDQKFYVYFRNPADWQNTVLLVWKHVDLEKDDDRWLYLPDLDLIKRIAAGDKRTSFAGSHFFYEDISGRNPNLDNHKLADTTQQYYVVESTPKNPKMVEFDRYRSYIHRDTFLPVQVDYFDSDGENYRRYSVEEVEHIQEYLTVTKSVMQDLRNEGNTQINYEKVEYNTGIPEDIFSERYLKRTPTEYLGLN